MPNMDIIVIKRLAGMGIRIPKRPIAVINGFREKLKNSKVGDGIMRQHVSPRYEDGKEA